MPKTPNVRGSLALRVLVILMSLVLLGTIIFVVKGLLHPSTDPSSVSTSIGLEMISMIDEHSEQPIDELPPAPTVAPTEVPTGAPTEEPTEPTVEHDYKLVDCNFSRGLFVYSELGQLYVNHQLVDRFPCMAEPDFLYGGYASNTFSIEGVDNAYIEKAVLYTPKGNGSDQSFDAVFTNARQSGTVYCNAGAREVEIPDTVYLDPDGLQTHFISRFDLHVVTPEGTSIYTFLNVTSINDDPPVGDGIANAIW